MNTTEPLEPGTVLFAETSDGMYHPRHYFLMACALHDAGMPAAVLAQPHPREHPEGPVPGIPLPRVAGRLSRMLSGPRVVLRIRRLKPAVVQINNLDLLPWGVLARYLLRIPVVYDSNDDYPTYMLLKDWLPRWLRPILARIVGIAEPALASRLDAVTTADAGTAVKFHGRVRRLTTVYNFPKREIAERARPATPEYDVTYPGTLHWYYREHMIETARLLEEDGVSARWCIAARGLFDDLRDDLERRLGEEGLRDRFTLKYDLPFTEVPDLVARSRIGFIPLPDEPKYRKNIPRKLFEFLAQGLPVVASDLPPIRDLVGDEGCCLLVRPGDNRGYADAVGRLLRDEDLRVAMGTRGRALILERFNAEAAVAEYVTTMKELAGGR